jgi:hypothetical protein
MRRATVLRSPDHWRRNFVTQSEKVIPDALKSKPQMVCDIFEPKPGRSGVIDNSDDVRPKVTRVLVPKHVAGNGERLAGISSNDSAYLVMKDRSVEG